jgi:tripartite-type tricarboxylate transporter receptor subunit TctC
MWTTVLCRAAVFLLAMIAFTGQTLGQGGSYPDRPIKFVVPYGPGGTVDPTARTLAARASEILGQPVVVENKAGAAGSIGTDFVVRAPADGYTVLVHTNVLASEPPLKPTLSYNFLKDMTPLLTIDETPFVLLVHPSLPVNSVKELVAYAKEHPGKLNYGASGVASSGHLRGEQFKLETGTNLVFVPYVDGGATLRGLLTNEIQLAFDTLPGSIGMIEGGKIKILAVGSPERWFLVPEGADDEGSRLQAASSANGSAPTYGPIRRRRLSTSSPRSSRKRPTIRRSGINTGSWALKPSPTGRRKR